MYGRGQPGGRQRRRGAPPSSVHIKSAQFVTTVWVKFVGPGASRFGAWVQVARACAARAGVGTWEGRGAPQAGQTVENGCGDALTFCAG